MNKQFSNLEKKQKSIIKKGLSSILGLLLSINLAIAVPIDQEKEASALVDETRYSFVWHAATLTTLVVTAGLALWTVTEYNKLAEKNHDLESDYEYTTTQTNLDEIDAAYESNKKDMKDFRQQLDIFNGLLLLALGWETWMLMSDGSMAAIFGSDDSRSHTTFKISLDPQFYTEHPGTGLTIKWTW